MKSIIYSTAILILFSLLVIPKQEAIAQEFPSKLWQEIPESAEILQSPDILKRASILKKIVVSVPRSCTGEQNLPIALEKKDYEFVVGKILELDLSAIDYKKDNYIWNKTQYLIKKFKMYQYLKPLSEYLNHPNMYVQAGIIYTIRDLNAKDFDTKLALLLNSSHKFIRDEILRTLIQFESKKAVPQLISLLYSPNYLQRYYALKSLIKVDGKQATPHIAKLLKDKYENNRFWAVDALVRLDARNQKHHIHYLLNSEQKRNTKIYAIAALIKFGDVSVIPFAINYVTLADLTPRGEMLRRITELKLKNVVPYLAEVLYSESIYGGDSGTDSNIRRDIIVTLGKLKSYDAVPVLRHYIKDKKSIFLLSATASALGDIGSYSASEDLSIVLRKLSYSVNGEANNNTYAIGQAAIALAKIGEKKYWKQLVNVIDNSNFPYRSQVVQELNKHLNSKLWKKIKQQELPLHNNKTIKFLSEVLSKESRIPIFLEFDPKKDISKSKQFVNRPEVTEGYPTSGIYNNMTMLDVLKKIPADISIYDTRMTFTFLFDGNEIRILSTENAVRWWKNKIIKENL